MTTKEFPKPLLHGHQWHDAEPHPNFWTMNQECYTVLRQDEHVSVNEQIVEVWFEIKECITAEVNENSYQ